MNRLSRRPIRRATVSTGSKFRVRAGRKSTISVEHVDTCESANDHNSRQNQEARIYPPDMMMFSDSGTTPTQMATAVMTKLYQFINTYSKGLAIQDVESIISIGSRQGFTNYTWGLTGDEPTISSLIVDLKELSRLTYKVWDVYSSSTKDTSEQMFYWIKHLQLLTKMLNTLDKSQVQPSESDKSITSDECVVPIVDGSFTVSDDPDA